MYQKDIAIIHVYASNNKAPMYMRQKLAKSKGDINNSNTIGGNFSAQISIKNKTTRKTINKEINLSNTINQLDPADTYRTLYLQQGAHSSQGPMDCSPGLTMC